MNKIIRIITLFACAAYLASCKGTYPIPNEEVQAQYKKDCTPIISWLETRYKLDGHYPDALTSDFDAKLKKINPYSRYELSLNKDHCSICIGDYVEHEWVYCWWSKNKRWNLDG